MSQKTYGKGEVIFQKGDYGDSLFQILKGSVDIVLDGGKDNAVLTELTEGKFFGEMGALTACPAAGGLSRDSGCDQNSILPPHCKDCTK